MSEPSTALPKALPGNAVSLASYFDHTVLRPDARTSDIETLCDEARRYLFKGVCVNPVYVARVARLLEGSAVLTVAVVGFPLGANCAELKAEEARRAVADGARELDTVINVGAYLSGEEALVRRDMAAVVQAAAAVPVKVILETGFLSKAQIHELTKWVAESGAAFVKTSTGFGPRGASLDDLDAMQGALRQIKRSDLAIKASGGIRTLDDAMAFIAAGAERLGASSSVKIINDFTSKIASEG